jgi:hypothetical protein
MDHSPEKQLWCAVIGRALQDAMSQIGPESQNAEQERVRDDARRWFIQNDSDFRRACDAAGYDADFLRARVLRLTATSDAESQSAPIAQRSAA